MDHLMPLRYVSFSYLSKVKSGGKVVHWTLTRCSDISATDVSARTFRPRTFRPWKKYILFASADGIKLFTTLQD